METVADKLKLQEKLKKLKEKTNQKPFGGKIGFHKGKKKQPKASAGRGIKTLKGLAGY